MRAADAGRLTALAAIWGASFLFTRIVAPQIGPLATADLRTLIAGVALAAYFALVGFDPQWRTYWRSYVAVGLLTYGFPFLLYAYAALTLPAGLMSVINATSPMWGALFSALLLGERLTPRAAAGLVAGVVGVALVTGPGSQVPFAPLAILAVIGACACYGFAAAYMRRWAAGVPARGMAVGTQLSAGVLLLPFALAVPPAAVPGAFVIACVAALGLVCGAVAYLLYFRLIADIGATGALTVTYLVPLFGVLWGALFLGEAVTLPMLGGAALVLLGTFLVLKT